MTLQTSGTITLQDIATEFGGTTPHSLSEYYGADTGVPTSGIIKFSDFYGTSSISPSTIYGVQSTQAFAGHGTSSISTTMSLGSAYSDREIWVVVIAMDPSSTNSVTVGGGGTATKISEHVSGGQTNEITISYWKYTDNGTRGTSATIAANLSTSSVHSGLVVFTTKASSYLDFYGSDNGNGLATSGSINTSQNGWAFYCACTQNGNSGTISEFGNTGTFDMGTGEWVTYGFNSPENDGTVAINSPSGASTSNNTITGLSTAGT